MTIVALDVDFHKIYAVSDLGHVLYKAESSRDAVIAGLNEYARGHKVLMEVASPVMYIRDIKVVYNVVKWALWNLTTAQFIDSNCEFEFLVAPSHVWTCGHNLALRHEVAGCKQKQKDLRECEAMIFYYKQDPEKWVVLDKYLEDL